MFYTKNDKNVAMLKLAHWYQKVEECGFKNFNVVLNSITVNYQSVLNYFDNWSTNASAESFNAKIRGFRSHFRGVRKIDFFLFGLFKLFWIIPRFCAWSLINLRPTFEIDSQSTIKNWSKKKLHLELSKWSLLYSERDLNPHEHCCSLDFKSSVSTNFTIRALLWYLQGSNQGHMDFQSIALPSELRYH